jgi:hypothetical protein
MSEINSQTSECKRLRLNLPVMKISRVEQKSHQDYHSGNILDMVEIVYLLQVDQRTCTRQLAHKNFRDS